jgi:nucleoid-associated protein YgaU
MNELRDRLKQTEDKLATSLRSYSILQSESDRLKNAASNQNDLAAELEALRKEKAELEASIAANPTDQSHHLASRLADTEDRLSTALRSYTLLQRENDELKGEAARAAEAAHANASRSATETANQVSALFDELRQTQARATALSAENSQLKTRLALAGSLPGSTLSSPTRPGTAQAMAASTPNAAPEAATPSAPASPRSHIVVSGDTLGKISRQYYGTAARWEEILRANRDVIKDENVLTVGTTLRLP